MYVWRTFLTRSKTFVEKYTLYTIHFHGLSGGEYLLIIFTYNGITAKNHEINGKLIYTPNIKLYAYICIYFYFISGT